MGRINTLLSVILLLLHLPLSLSCNPKCKFSRCKNGRAFRPFLIDQSFPLLLRAQEKRWLPYICRADDARPLRLHFVTTRQARVRPNKATNKPFVPISKYSPPGLTRPFHRKYFDVGKLRRGEWVVVRRRTRGNQEDFLDDLCVSLPIKGYRYLRTDGRPRKKWNFGISGSGDCVSFRTRTVQLLFELRWNSVDDMDLAVEEPSGKIASRFYGKSCGKLAGDVGSQLGVCTNIPDKSESIRYFNCVPKGKYKIRVTHYRNCGKGATKYEVRVTRKGRLIYNKLGSSNARDFKLVEEIELNL